MQDQKAARVNSAREWALEQKANKYAESQGYLVLKFTPVGQRGWPDRLYINEFGIHVFIEYKRFRKDLRKLQNHRHEQLTARGVYCYGPVDDLIYAIEILRTHATEKRMDTPRVPRISNPADAETG